HRVAVEQAPATQRTLGVWLAMALAAPRGAGARGKLEHAAVLPALLQIAAVGAARHRRDEEGGVLRHPVALRWARGEQQDRPAGPLAQGGGHQGARGAPEAVGAETECSR